MQYMLLIYLDEQGLSDAQREALLAKTAGAASRGEFEPFKTTSVFDSTASNPAWLGEESQRVKQLEQAMPH